MSHLLHNLESARQDAAMVLKEQMNSMCHKFQTKVHDPGFHVGDTVYLYHLVLSPDQSAKLQSPWSGTHYIVRKFRMFMLNNRTTNLCHEGFMSTA